MPRETTDYPDIKVRVEPQEKAVFIAAAKKARQSITQWVISACLEKAERDGVTLPKRRRS